MTTRSALSVTGLAAILGAACTALAAGGDEGGEGHWPSFRGPQARGVAEGHSTAATWNLEAREHVRWKVPVPGLAHSSPAIWGEKIFLTTAVRQGGEDTLKVGLFGDIAPVDDDSPHEFRVLCFDRSSGKELWSQTAWSGVPAVKRHPKGSHAASSPATDGRHVVALFGTEGLYCYDIAGELRWHKDLGDLDSGYYQVPEAQWGFGSSPVIHEDLLLVLCDVQQNSFIAAFKVEDGTEVWRMPRNEVPTWGSPTVDVAGGRSQVVVNGWRHIGGYDLRSGRELWRLTGGGDIPVPTPIVAGDLIFITNAHGRMAPIYAIKAGAQGDLSGREDGFAWWIDKRGNYMQTPLVYGEHLYCCTDSGILSCYVAASGENVYRNRLGTGTSGFTASIVAADGKVYATSETGEVHVVRAGKAFEVLSVNEMGESCMATPAIAQGVLYWRTHHHLVAIAPPAGVPAAAPGAAAPAPPVTQPGPASDRSGP